MRKEKGLKKMFSPAGIITALRSWKEVAIRLGWFLPFLCPLNFPSSHCSSRQYGGGERSGEIVLCLETYLLFSQRSRILFPALTWPVLGDPISLGFVGTRHVHNALMSIQAKLSYT